MVLHPQESTSGLGLQVVPTSPRSRPGSHSPVLIPPPLRDGNTCERCRGVFELRL
jgi:hypothetical protein